jgi:hypothetical protein
MIPVGKTLVFILLFPMKIQRTEQLIGRTREELKQFLRELQAALQEEFASGRTIDEILDREDPFAVLEPLLQPEEYPIFVLAMINNIQSDVVMDTLLDALEKGLQKYRTKRER